LNKLSQLRNDFVHRRMEFIHIELETGDAMVRLAQTERELGHSDRAEHQLILAERACQEAQKRIGECERAEWPAAFDSAKQKLADLMRRISDFRKSVWEFGTSE
jgi:hypothetical protein